MFDSPFTSDIAFVFRTSKDNDFENLSSKEKSLLSITASDKRKSQFANGRIASAEALAKLGLQTNYIAIGSSGEPIWESGVTGSITHSGSFAAVAVTRKAEGRALGIDLERIDKKLEFDISEKFCTETELDWIKQPNSAYSPLQKIIILFSCKESVYKAIFHLTGQPHRFKLMQLTPSDQNSFNLSLLGNLVLPTKKVGFTIKNNYVLSYTCF